MKRGTWEMWRLDVPYMSESGWGKEDVSWEAQVSQQVRNQLIGPSAGGEQWKFLLFSN